MNREKALSFATKFGVILAGFEDDEDIVSCAIRVNGIAIESASDQLKKSIDMIEIAAQDKGFDIITYLEKLVSKNPSLKQNDEFMRKIIFYNPYLLGVSSNNIKDDNAIAEYCVKFAPNLIEKVSDRLKKNTILWNIACENKKFDLVKFLEDLISKGSFFTSDDEFMRNAINVDVSFIEHGSETIKGDKALAMKCVKTIPTLTESVSKDLQDDYEVAACALSNAYNGDAYYIFNTLSDRLKKNTDLWQIALNDKGFDLYDYMETLVKEDPKLLGNVDFMKEATKYNQALLIDAAPVVVDNEEIVTPCVNKFGFLYNYVSKRLKNNLKVVKSAIKGYKSDYERGDYELEDNLIAKMYKSYKEDIKNDPDVAMFAVVSDSNNVKYVSDELRRTTDIVKYGVISAVNEYFAKAGNPKDKYVSKITSSVSDIVADNARYVVEEEVKEEEKPKNKFNDEFTEEERQKIYDRLKEQFDVLDEYSNYRQMVR